MNNTWDGTVVAGPYGGERESRWQRVWTDGTVLCEFFFVTAIYGMATNNSTTNAAGT